MSEPKVSFGKPKYIQNFDEYTKDDVFIYIEKFIEPKGDELIIKFHKVLGIKYLSIEGVRSGL